jgi:predicted aspartyl protease
MKSITRLTLSLAFLVLTLGLALLQSSQVSVPAQSNDSSRLTLRSITLSADITIYGGILLQTHVNNSQPMWFYLDSGASSAFILDKRRASALGLELEQFLSGGGGAGPNLYEFAKAKGVSISLSGLAFSDQSVAVFPLAEIEEQFGRSIDGLVGIDLFTNYVVEVDYIDKKVRLYNPQTFKYSGSGDSIPLALRDGHFFVPAKVEMRGRAQLKGEFVVDTGGYAVTAVLTTPFAQSNNLPAPDQKTILDRSMSGLGGETKVLIGRATSFTLGSSVVRAPVIYMSQDKGGALASSEYDGLIGTEVLRRFKIIFDYTRRRLILERNAHYDEPLEYDMSGISFRAYGNDFRTFRIYQVLDDSPAAKGGLRVGDVLLSIDDVPASRLTLEQIIQMLKVEGREYRLSMKRGSETISVTIKTRRMI